MPVGSGSSPDGAAVVLQGFGCDLKFTVLASRIKLLLGRPVPVSRISHPRNVAELLTSETTLIHGWMTIAVRPGIYGK